MHPGKYPMRAVFSVPGNDTDEIGNVSDALTVIGRAWVSVEPLSAREFLLAGGEEAKVSHKVKLATPSFDIPVAAVMTVRERIFAVEAPLSAPGALEMTLMCSERAV